MSKKRIQLLTKKLNKALYDHYDVYGRHTLPWRMTTDPYKILVSEMMLQQTQVSRVIEKYKNFLTLFPTVQDLARASLASVLIAWSGLGYNRRAKYLHYTAQKIVTHYGGLFPQNKSELQTFPGIGAYTAGAVCAFAFNHAEILIETNIRTVFIQHFFPRTKKGIPDKKIVSLIELAIDKHNPRVWYWALMDYGAYLKQKGNIVHRKSMHYKKQKPFKGSTRQLRGAILRMLIEQPITVVEVMRETKVSKNEVIVTLFALKEEGLITKKGHFYRLATL